MHGTALASAHCAGGAFLLHMYVFVYEYMKKYMFAKVYINPCKYVQAHKHVNALRKSGGPGFSLHRRRSTPLVGSTPMPAQAWAGWPGPWKAAIGTLAWCLISSSLLTSQAVRPPDAPRDWASIALCII